MLEYKNGTSGPGRNLTLIRNVIPLTTPRIEYYGYSIRHYPPFNHPPIVPPLYSPPLTPATGGATGGVRLGMTQAWIYAIK